MLQIRLHREATPTPGIGAAIQTSSEPARQMAEHYGISEQTVWKWRKRASIEDHSQIPHRQTTPTTGLWRCARRFPRPLRDSVMFGGSFDLAMLSGPMALHRAKRF